MKDKKTLKDISFGEDTRLLEKIRERNINRKQIRTQGRIALAILLRLDELGMNQTDLAEKLDVSRQYVSKLVKGKEKFGSDILVKLEEVLDMPIFVQNLPQVKQEFIKGQPRKAHQFEGVLETPVEETLNLIENFRFSTGQMSDTTVIEFCIPPDVFMTNSKNFC